MLLHHLPKPPLLNPRIRNSYNCFCSKIPSKTSFENYTCLLKTPLYQELLFLLLFSGQCSIEKTPDPLCVGIGSIGQRRIKGGQKKRRIIQGKLLVSWGFIQSPDSQIGGARLLGSGPSGLLDFVLHAFRALRPCDPRNGAMIG